MLLTASDGYTLHRPSKCERRIYLRQQGVEATPPGPFEAMIRQQGKRHEQNHLQTFPQFEDLSSGSRMERYVRTREAVANRLSVVYQAALSATVMLNDVECEVVGDPDFLIYESGRYIIRDSKIARNITEKDHPEILWQLRIYGWLYEQSFGEPPARLEVHGGTGEVVEVPNVSATVAEQLLGEILAIKQAASEPFSPVGWSKCGGCGFRGYCWPRATAQNDVAQVFGVDQGLAIALRGEGIVTIEEFLSRFNEDSLTDFQRPWGNRSQRVGKKAPSILRMARSLASGKEILIEPPAIPDYPHYVMFDLEGLPPQFEQLGTIYLWGLQVFPEGQSGYQAAVADFGSDGDRNAWEEFLTMAGRIFDQYGDLPFVHWHRYERTHLDMYVERFGDRDGNAERIRRNLLDLHPVTENSVALPLSSYSLKEVEKHVGFRRSQDEFGGEWSMARFIEATETDDKEQRAEIMDEIKTYNREDLAAMWAVFTWLKGL